MKKTNLILLFLAFTLIANAQIYNEDDKEGLRAFLAQPSALAGKTNGERIGLTPDDMQSWLDNEECIVKI